MIKRDVAAMPSFNTSATLPPGQSAPALFAPFKCKGLTLPNRIVMAPMTRSFTQDGAPIPQVADYYASRIDGGVGLVITEGAVIERPAAKNDIALPDFHGEALKSWKGVFDAVHERGGRIAPQLWHVGAIGMEDPDKWNPQPVDSPSGTNSFKLEAQDGAAPASQEAIADIVASFARSASYASALGADAIELHGAHGYLIDQFFWDETNHRKDAWGGRTLKERARFAAEVIREVRKSIPHEMPLSLRISQWKIGSYEAKVAENATELEQWLAPLADAGVDIFHCSQRRFWEPEFEGSHLNLAGWVKRVTEATTITVGSVGLDGDFIGSFQGKQSESASLDEVERRLEQGEFDLVAVGRAILADPDWALKVKEGRTDFRPFTPESLKDLI